jgi:hypothetical protein
MYFSTPTCPALSFTASCAPPPQPPLLSVVTKYPWTLLAVIEARYYPLDVRRLLGRLVDAGAADEQELPHAGRLRPVHHRPAHAQPNIAGHHGSVIPAS